MSSRRWLLAPLALAALAAAPSAAQGADYVGMGDSYSSGTGTQGSYGTCERTDHAYPKLIDPQLPGTMQFVACGGAKTNNITTSGQSGEPAQGNASGLDAGTDYVTLTIGGNDAGFSDVLLQCGYPFVSCDSDINAAQAYIQDTLPGRLDAVLNKIRQEAPNTRIGAVSYPRIFPADGDDCSAATFFSSGEITRLNQTADMMANVTRTRARAHGITFINAIPAYLGHAWCEDEWINGLSDPTNNSYHPNQSGHQGYAGIVRAAMLAAPAPSQTPGPNGRIAFTSSRDGDNEVYVINGNGDFPVNLTDNPASDRDPAFSPDGTKLAFVSDRDGDADVYVMNADGSGITNLTNNHAGDDLEPSWAPNGARIAFRRDLSGNNEIYSMTSTGGSQTRLTNNSASDFSPAWSPDGAEIAFQRFASNNEVMKMNADGQGQLNLTNNSANDGRPSWSPNGNTIAFHSNRTGEQFDIYTIAATGGTATRRTTDPGSDQRPTWSPSGAQLAFTSSRDGNIEIYTMTSSGASQTRRTDNGATDTYPSWQGDGTPPETAIDAGPPSPTNDPSPQFEFSSSELGSSFQCSLDGGAYATCGSPHVTAELPDGPHTVAARAVDPSGNADPTAATHPFTVDTEGQQTTITEGPSGPTNDPSPVFQFESDDLDATFECSLDGAPFQPCASPQGYADLPEGDHTFAVLGIDSAGNPDPEPASREFSVDLTPPDVMIDFAPPALTADRASILEFSSEDTSASFECRLDPGDGTAWEECSSPHLTPELDDGPHLFEVRSLDPAGNPSLAPASASFEVDATAPETNLVSPPPPDPSTERTLSFEFDSDDSGAGFECRLDSSEEADWEECASPLVTPELADGPHSFDVRARDAAGNADETPVLLSFGVDATAPETTITSAPASPGKDRTPTFRFASDDPAAELACRLDTGGWQPCQSPYTVAQLGEGPHTFEVRGVDPYGNLEPEPAVAAFTIDVTAPQTQIDSGPEATTDDPDPSFSFSSEPGATFECSLDGAPFEPCLSPHTTPGLANGAHELAVRALDAAGNADPSPATRAFTVDTTASPGDPGAPGGSGVAGEQADPCATLGRGSNGRDRLVGTEFGDRLLGLRGDDLIEGLAGDDCLLGGPGKDVLVGGAGGDTLVGGPGPDKHLARDGERDLVRCGKGRDRALVDQIDALKGCEIVKRRKR